MAKRPARTWATILSQAIPLSIVAVVAMAISYATLIDVARVNGLPLPELFPILIDVGSISCMISAGQFRRLGIGGRWLAYTTFALLSCVSIVANASHAGRAADMTLTTPWIAAVLAAVPPIVLIALTHLVMKSIPDEKERAKLNAVREAHARREQQQAVAPRPEPKLQQRPNAEAPAPAPQPVEEQPKTAGLRLVDEAPRDLPEISDDEVERKVLEYFVAEGKRPTGQVVADWLGGKSAKTGQRFLARMESDGHFEAPAPESESAFALGSVNA
ncbi:MULTISPECIES: DUF2637 domain-containing protein [unclassified Leucobacter]|uniref:DUF2637 domain-containing protein n=1 Tax=unclassified Leucobacter TaxID=2621730 RepID=UPI00301B29EB